jgi:transcriptional regulator with XRE-family HTH domain
MAFVTNSSRQIGEMIRVLRHMSKLTQLQLAERCGLSRASIANIETGRQTLTEPVVNEIALVLGYRVKIKFERIVNEQ